MAAEPIVAIATPPGRGGIGIVRVSGGDIAPVIDALLGPKAGQLMPRVALHAPFLGADGSAIDDGIALLFPAPHSYTGENVLELQGHGGPVVLRLIVERCLEAGRAIGLRIAQPGEFTERAFLNDRLDLAQAEAVADLIDASTELAARSAVRSLAGEFSRRVHALHDALVELRMLVEATLDFPEEEIDFLQKADAVGRLQRLKSDLERLLAQSRQGAVLRDGLDVVLVGAPNVGKSSLLNALAGEEVAIVTAVPGTTRDRIARTISVDGIPLNIIDTAGLRATADEVEKLGIERTLGELERADAVLHLVDSVHPDRDEDVMQQVHARVGRGVPVLTVLNKIDLAGQRPDVDASRVWLSAKTGAGVDLLRGELKRIAGWERDTMGETLILARARHVEALQRARLHLASAAEHAAQRDCALELFAEDLRLAGNALSEITGEFTADDLLGAIFSRFCIGK
ncbi:MAG: tRNA uridine-5-carboxymethylaminomethyl(34) synthesis GTPase MnmE [Burkholderiaceae bacterium]